jgi:hypothetical protein
MNIPTDTMTSTMYTAMPCKEGPSNHTHIGMRMPE